ncbi:MAG: T9SS type B sorting domain-containing protein [Jejuia sp.]
MQINKRFIFCVAFLHIFLFGFSQNTFVPDDNFEQALIDLGLDTPPLNDVVPTVNIVNIIELDLNLLNISDLTGIEDFRGLSILDCSRNQLSQLDVSNNSNLTQLFCHDNQLSTLDVTQNSVLNTLWCYRNKLSNMDVTQNRDLVSLVCWENNLTNLNTSNNPELVVLGCEINSITSLDLSNNQKLRRFQCWNNLLTELDLSNNPDITYLDCSANRLSNLNLESNSFLRTFLCSNNILKTLDLSKNTGLLNLDCSNNNLCSLNIKNGNNENIAFLDFNNNPDLTCIIVDDSTGDRSLWEPQSFTNYVIDSSNCGTIPIDSFSDFSGFNYILPDLENGNYYSESGGMGFQYNAGDEITSTQTIYIYRFTECGSTETSFNVVITERPITVPKYFTPNNDGENDIWQIEDPDNRIKSITIHNRFGKLLKFLPKNNDFKWNGSFNGINLPNDSYWYIINLNSGNKLSGYFALKR